MDKLYLNEIRPDGEISTVGLYYSREEAENVLRQLGSLPEKRGCQYVITDRMPSGFHRRERGGRRDLTGA